MELTTLIDSDLVAFRVAATVPETDPFELCQQRIDVLMQQILDSTGATSYKAFLTGRNNFRKVINPEYKANRKDKEPPFYLQDCRKYLIDNWNAIVTEGCEADDALGINQNDQTCIASLDKDLLTVPGKHYNWVKQEWTDVDELSALHKLYSQALIGDTADNIIGVAGLGKVKAARIIEPLENEDDMARTVYRLYDYDYDRFVMNMSCLYIMHNEAEFWTTKLLKQKPSWILQNLSLLEAIIRFDSMISLKDGTSTEHILTAIPKSGGRDSGIGQGATPNMNAC